MTHPRTPIGKDTPLTDHRSLRQKLRYQVDNTMASGTKAMIISLAAGTIALIVIVSLVETIIAINANVGDSTGPLSFWEALWQSFLRAIDSGTMSADEGVPFRIASLVITIGGILVVSSLIGLLANGVAEKVAELRRGRSPVFESGHTLILGWSPKIFPIISELTIANENLRGASIVVLAPFEKDEMEREIDDRIPNKRGTRVVFRTGIPYESLDLLITRPSEAKSVILLNAGGDDGDAEVVKAALALLHTTAGADPVPVVAEIHDSSTALSLREGTAGAVDVLRSADIIARVTAQVSRQPGLSAVYQDLFDFEGDEIYFRDTKELVGETFGSALLAFDEASPLGIRHTDGRVELNPSPDTVLREGDHLVVVAADDDKIIFTGLKAMDVTAPARSGKAAAKVETMLLIGWNDMAPQIIRELDSYVAADSKLIVSVDEELVDRSLLQIPGDLRSLECEILTESLNRKNLQEVMAEHMFDHVIILCYRGRLTVAQADARVLLTLLHLRATIEAAGTDTNIVVELLDERDVELSRGRETDEFIVSERLTALLMAQLSENHELGSVFDDLLDEAGCEIYLKPTSLYLEAARSTTFAELVAAARSRGEVALGFQTKEADGNKISINPPKGTTVEMSASDFLIVLAEDED